MIRNKDSKMSSSKIILEDSELAALYADLMASPKGKLSTITAVTCDVGKDDSNEEASTSPVIVYDHDDDGGYHDAFDKVDDMESASPRKQDATRPSPWRKFGGNGESNKARVMFKAAAFVSGATAQRRFRKANKPSRSKRNQVASETSLHYDCEEMKEVFQKEDHLSGVGKSYTRLGSVMKLSEVSVG